MRPRALAVLAVLGLAALTAAARKPKPPLPEVTGPAVTISIRTTPRSRAQVWWGRKLLGTTPLKFERPQDSGPMDLMIRAPGYLPVRTRAYTFSDDTLFITMTHGSDRAKLFGYRRELPPDGGVPDGGVPDAGAPEAAAPDAGGPVPPWGAGPSP